MKTETAIGVINSLIHIDAVRTHRGDEVKCWVLDENDGGRIETYLDAKDCFELAECFEAIGLALSGKSADGDPLCRARGQGEHGDSEDCLYSQGHSGRHSWQPTSRDDSTEVR